MMDKQYEMIRADGAGPVPTGAIEPLFREVRLRRSEEVGPFVRGVAAALAALGHSSLDCMSLGSALIEAITNSLGQGNEGDPPKHVRVRYRVTCEAVLIDVQDAGPGYSSGPVPDAALPEHPDQSSERDLHSRSSFTTWLRYSARGSHVTLFKCRSA
jgi:anti-sigma regulatory factor (Ser/Thr protein kinase)